MLTTIPAVPEIVTKHDVFRNEERLRIVTKNMVKTEIGEEVLVQSDEVPAIINCQYFLKSKDEEFLMENIPNLQKDLIEKIFYKNDKPYCTHIFRFDDGIECFSSVKYA